MPWYVRAVLWFGCGEWLFVLRRWFAFRALFALTAILAIRMLCQRLIPSWDFYLVFWGAQFLVLGRHLFPLLTGRTRFHRNLYDLPATGAPSLIFIGRNWKVTTLLVEPLVVLAVLFALMAQAGKKLYRPFPLTPLLAYFQPYAAAYLPTATLWDQWIDEHALFIATVQPLLSVLVLFCHNLGEILAARERAPVRRSDDLSFVAVREQTHTIPSLPSVKDLADDLQQLY